MKYLIVLSLLLTSCAVNRTFPDIPPSLKEECENLKTVPNDTTKLSDALEIITNNYTLYHTCKYKNQAWLTWYEEQKKIFGGKE